jgi:signal transduction histidine kinase
VGFNPRQIGNAHKAGALGLLGIQDRLAALNGMMTIDSQPGQGTRMTVTIPL